MKKVAVGIDFGGTNTKLGMLDKTGRILAEASFSTRESSKPAAFVARVGKVLSDLLAETGGTVSDIAGVGIGVPGLVDNERGIIHTLTNVPGWNGVPVCALFKKRLNLPTCVENDVNAMALGEHWCGVARGYENVLCVTLGTGIGGGIIIGGRLYRGATLTAGEIGHMVMEPQGPRCGCGKRGCLEALIGTKGLLQRAADYLKINRPGILARWLREGEDLTPLLLAKAAHEGDRTALRVWDDAARTLGMAFGNIANLLNPDVFVVGGGISAVGDFFFRKVREVSRETAMSVPARKLKIVRSGLGNRAGVVGAASLVFGKIEMSS